MDANALLGMWISRCITINVTLSPLLTFADASSDFQRRKSRIVEFIHCGGMDGKFYGDSSKEGIFSNRTCVAAEAAQQEDEQDDPRCDPGHGGGTLLGWFESSNCSCELHKHVFLYLQDVAWVCRRRLITQIDMFEQHFFLFLSLWLLPKFFSQTVLDCFVCFHWKLQMCHAVS